MISIPASKYLTRAGDYCVNFTRMHGQYGTVFCVSKVQALPGGIGGEKKKSNTSSIVNHRTVSFPAIVAVSQVANPRSCDLMGMSLISNNLVVPASWVCRPKLIS